MYTLKLADTMLFLSTLSLRRATAIDKWDKNDFYNFYPRSPCGERHTWQRGSRITYVISIHALLAESDKAINISSHGNNNFYPRSPCGERPTARRRKTTDMNFYPRSPCGERHIMTTTICIASRFLSTLSLRRATGIIDIINNVINDFYPRSPCGERQMHALIFANPVLFLSTLSLRRATKSHKLAGLKLVFLSTLSLRRATARRASRQQPEGISIHALLAESDYLGAG